MSLLKKASIVGKTTARLLTLFDQKKPGAMVRAAATATKCAVTELALRQAGSPWYYRIYDPKKHKLNLKNILKLTSSALKCSAMFIPGLGPCAIVLPYLTKATMACSVIESWKDVRKLTAEHKFTDIFKAVTFEALSVSASLSIEMMCGAGTPLEMVAMSLIASMVIQQKNHLNECGAKNLSALAKNISRELSSAKSQSHEKKLFLQYLKVGKASASIIEAWKSLFGKKPSDVPVAHITETAKSIVKKKQRNKKKNQTSQPSSQQKQTASMQKRPSDIE